jgi:hypothetical protein
LVFLLGYIIAFRYQLGFAEFFGVPADFIELSLSNVLFAIFAVMAVAWGCFQ